LLGRQLVERRQGGDQQMLIDSTVMAPGERAEAIREVIWSSVVRVEVTHQPDPRLIRTAGVISRVGPLTACSVRANATIVRRTPALAPGRHGAERVRRAAGHR